jgi:hypothetical protein
VPEDVRTSNANLRYLSDEHLRRLESHPTALVRDLAKALKTEREDHRSLAGHHNRYCTCPEVY